MEGIDNWEQESCVTAILKRKNVAPLRVGSLVDDWRSSSSVSSGNDSSIWSPDYNSSGNETAIFNYEPWSTSTSAETLDFDCAEVPPIGRPIFGRRFDDRDRDIEPKPADTGYGFHVRRSERTAGRNVIGGDSARPFIETMSAGSDRPAAGSAREVWAMQNNNGYVSSLVPIMVQYCVLCAKNGEVREYVMSHNLKDKTTGLVECPTLRKFVCPICGATGDHGHTESYCPKRHIGRSVTMALKNTLRNSTGIRRTVAKPGRRPFFPFGGR